MPDHFINGVWHAGSGPLMKTTSPVSGVSTWSGHQAGAADVHHACTAAREQFEVWSALAPAERMAVCERFRELLRTHAESLADLISLEIGKPHWEALAEVASMANKVTISMQAYRLRTGEARAQIADGTAILRHRPHGVFAVFGPYNFPGHLPNGHIVPALIAGNTLVFKPSEHAPQTAIRTVGLWHQAGLPAGVLNLVNGGRETGMLLAQHPALDGVLFTGSAETGAALHRQFAGQPGKLLALEMGGNNALVVWDVQYLDAAVHHTIFSAFISAGQRCSCARRLIVEDSPAGAAFLRRLVEVAGTINVGKPEQQPPPFMGPVVSAAAAQKLLQAQADLLRRGGRSLLPMTPLVDNTGFLSPGIVDVTDAAGVPDEELFGPLLQVIRVKDFDTALAAANATAYGLAAGLLSDSDVLWRRFVLRVRAGVVNWNRPTTGAASTAPFGGIGNSGNHRPSAFYAADYCAYPVASIESAQLEMPSSPTPGLTF